MFVNIESVELHAQLENRYGRPLSDKEFKDDVYGLPPLSEERDDEIFGPYELDGREVFSRYTAATRTWDVLVSENAEEIALGAADIDRGNRKRLFDAIKELSTLPRPTSCSTPNVLTHGPSFTFNNWQFRWYWVPELGRWELARR